MCTFSKTCESLESMLGLGLSLFNNFIFFFLLDYLLFCLFLFLASTLRVVLLYALSVSSFLGDDGIKIGDPRNPGEPRRLMDPLNLEALLLPLSDYSSYRIDSLTSRIGLYRYMFGSMNGWSSDSTAFM